MMRDALDLGRHLYRRFGVKTLNPRFWAPVLGYASGLSKLPTPSNLEKRSLAFPADHYPHDCTIEWWYLNGFVESVDERLFAVHYALFMIRPRHLGLTGTLGQSKIAPAIFSSILDSETAQTHKHSALVKSAEVRFDGTNFSVQDPLFDLNLVPDCHPLPVRGDGYVDFPLDPMFYYSLPKVKLDGEIKINGRRLAVTGVSWFDHQWGNRIFQDYQWTWVSINLQSGFNIVACQYGTDQEQTFFTLQSPNGKVYDIPDAKFEPGNEVWQNPRTKRQYVLDWKITAPSIELEIDVHSLGRDCEMSLGYLHYFESPTRVTAKIFGRELRGQGFLEITRSGKV